MSKSKGTVPTVIVDKNGKQTTVHRKTMAVEDSSRIIPPVGVTAAVDSQSIPTGNPFKEARENDPYHYSEISDEQADAVFAGARYITVTQDDDESWNATVVLQPVDMVDFAGGQLGIDTSTQEGADSVKGILTQKYKDIDALYSEFGIIAEESEKWEEELWAVPVYLGTEEALDSWVAMSEYLNEHEELLGARDFFENPDTSKLRDDLIELIKR